MDIFGRKRIECYRRGVACYRKVLKDCLDQIDLCYKDTDVRPQCVADGLDLLASTDPPNPEYYGVNTDTDAAAS